MVPGSTQEFKMDAQIDHVLFNEIGVDSQVRLKKFSRITRKVQSLMSRMSPALKDAIKSQFNKTPNISDEEFFRNLLSQNDLLCELLDLILYASKNLNLKFSRELYQKEFQTTIPNEESYLQKIVFEGYFHPEKDLLRKIHYYTYLEVQQYIEANSSANLGNVVSLDLNDAQIEGLLQNSSVLKQKGKIKVWYALKMDDGLAIFIYVDARKRKIIPSTIRKRNNFIQYSRPNIIYLKNQGRKILIYSRDVGKSIKYASAFFYEQTDKTDPFKIIYETKEKESRLNDVNRLIDNLLKNRVQELTLESITFFPDQATYDGALIRAFRGSGTLTELSQKLTSSFGVDFTVSNVQEIEVSHDGVLFKLIFRPNEDKVIVNYNYLARNQKAGSDFEIFLQRHEIKINKKTR